VQMQRPTGFLRPGALSINPGSLQDRDNDAPVIQAAPPAAGRHALPIAKHSARALPLPNRRSANPITLEDKLLYAIEKHQVVIVVGQTGCGCAVILQACKDLQAWLTRSV